MVGYILLIIVNKILKKLIIILVLFVETMSLVSCSTEDAQRTTEQFCECVEKEEYSTNTTNYQIWILTNAVYPTDYTCVSNGYTYFKYSYTSGTGEIVRVRNRVECNQ